MKKLTSFLMLSASLLVSLNTQARKPIVFGVNADNGRWDFFYDRIRYIPGSIDNVEGIWLFCNDPGWSRCRTSNASQGSGGVFFPGDNIDQNNFDSLLEFAEQQISLNKPVGSHQVRIRVAGENVDRVYTINWVASTNGGYKATLKFNEL